MKLIKLSRGYETKVDDNVCCHLLYKSWHVKPHGKTHYARHCDSGKNVYLHRLILNAPIGLEVDHIDGDGLNNTRANLRIVTRRQQMQNQHGVSKTSKYPGVYWNSSAKKWQAYAHHKNKAIYLGIFAREVDAAAKSRSFRRFLPK